MFFGRYLAFRVSFDAFLHDSIISKMSKTSNLHMKLNARDIDYSLILSFMIFYQVLKHLDFTFVSNSEQKLWIATLSVFKSTQIKSKV